MNTPKWIRLIGAFRVALPIRLLISYLLIVLVGALPTYFFVRIKLEKKYTDDGIHKVIERTKQISNFLNPLPTQKRLLELKRLSSLIGYRITYIDSKGVVKFDTSMTYEQRKENHLQRREIQEALGKKDLRQLPLDTKAKGMGLGMRYSPTTKEHLIYVALQLAPEGNQPPDFLRVAVQSIRAQRLFHSFYLVFRNSQAVAVSIALILSLVSALLFVRPLHKLVAKAQQLSEGDYHLVEEDYSSDEVGDVGKALQKLSLELRRRMALAEASIVLFSQLVETLNSPIIVYDEDGNIVTYNSSARELFRNNSHDPVETMVWWFQEPSIAKIRSELKEHAPSARTEVVIEGRDYNKKVEGFLQNINHPSGRKFYVFLGENSVREFISYLPLFREFEIISLQEILQNAHQRVSRFLTRFEVDLPMPEKVPDVEVVEIQQRLLYSFMLLFQEMILVSAFKEKTGAFFVEEERGFVKVVFEINAHAQLEFLLSNLITPIGGEFINKGGACILKLPKA